MTAGGDAGDAIGGEEEDDMWPVSDNSGVTCSSERDVPGFVSTHRISGESARITTVFLVRIGEIL